MQKDCLRMIKYALYLISWKLNKCETVFYKQLEISEDDHKVNHLKSVKKSSSSFSRTLFQSQNILLAKVHWEKGTLKVDQNSLNIEQDGNTVFEINPSSNISY